MAFVRPRCALVVLSLLGLGCARGADTGARLESSGPVASQDATSRGLDESMDSTGPSIDSSGDTSNSTTTGAPPNPGPSGETGGVATTDPVDGSTSGDATTSAGDDSTTGSSAATDLSGFTLLQMDSSRELTLPPGTSLLPGQSLVVIRGGDLVGFESFWNVDLGDAVVVDGGGEFPAINGAETFSLLDAGGAVIDGPTPSLDPDTGLVREEPIEGDTWAAEPASAERANPGDGPASDGDGRPYIAEVSDAPATLTPPPPEPRRRRRRPGRGRLLATRRRQSAGFLHPPASSAW